LIYDFLNKKILTGNVKKFGEAFSTFLEYIVNLSKGMISKSRKREYTLSPAVISSFSSALKVLARKLRRYETEITP